LEEAAKAADSETARGMLGQLAWYLDRVEVRGLAAESLA